MNKSLMATWVGMQVKAGRLRTDLPIKESLQARYPDRPELYERLSDDLSLEHFMAMSTGIDFEEQYTPGDDVTNMLYRADVAWEVPVMQGHVDEPGNLFRYSSGDTNVVSYFWQQTLTEPYWQWIDNRFSQVLGLDDLTAEPDVSGVQMGSSYLYMTPRDWLKVGEFWRQSLAGSQTLLPEGWMNYVTTAKPSSVRQDYGLGFWLNNNGVAFPDAPENLFYAGGNSGQFVVVLPDQELVVVRLGLSRVHEGMNALLAGLVERLGDTD
jgi:CubicO group peptidase (beta-lactamase class C family)